MCLTPPPPRPPLLLLRVPLPCAHACHSAAAEGPRCPLARLVATFTDNAGVGTTSSSLAGGPACATLLLSFDGRLPHRASDATSPGAQALLDHATTRLAAYIMDSVELCDEPPSVLFAPVAVVASGSLSGHGGASGGASGGFGGGDGGGDGL